MSAPTPGPWRYNARQAYVEGTDGEPVALPHAHLVRRPDAERQANARLIAAAPEMYELIQRLAELTCDEETPDAGDVLAARSLVEKIGGGK